MRAVRLSDSTTFWFEQWQIDTEISDTILYYININFYSGLC